MRFVSFSSVSKGCAFGLAVLLLVAGWGFTGAAESEETAGLVMVGFAPGTSTPAALEDAPGDVVGVDAELGLAFLATRDVDAALGALADAEGVDFVDVNGRVHAADAEIDSARWDTLDWESARWDSARWDSARWDSARWDSARWDSARWDSARWDSARWDSARWDSARWDGGAFTPDPLLQYQWGLDDLKVPQAWRALTGSHERTICVIDTGVDATHPDLAPNAWRGPDGAHGWDFVDDDADPSDPVGHGTHVAGVAAAAVGNGDGTAGVVDALVMAVRVLDVTGEGSEADLARGIKWCADHDADVISMSLSTHEDSPAVHRAVQDAWARGSLLVASAGNADECAACPSYPAAYPEVLAVGALQPGREPAAFSQRGDFVDLAAPGVRIAGPFLNHGYALGSGTSQATAYVAGAAALAWDANPDLTNVDLTGLFRDTVRDVGERGWDDATGWGEPDVNRLVRAALRHR